MSVISTGISNDSGEDDLVELDIVADVTDEGDVTPDMTESDATVDRGVIALDDPILDLENVSSEGDTPVKRRVVIPSPNEILSSLDVSVPRLAVSSGYGIALGLLAVWLTLIPVVYLSLVAFLAFLVVWHAYEALATFSDGPYFIFHLPMAFFGGLLLVFLIKPVFFRRRPKTAQIISLSEHDEPLLFAYVRKLCLATGSQPPRSIEVDCDANAHARIVGILGGGLVLRIGLPLAADLTLRQFTGVLAHEFGHFNQRHGMKGSYLIRRLSFFFAQIVFQRDKLDERHARHRRSRNVFRQGYYWAMWGAIEAARGVLWLMLVVSELLTCGVLRRMEYDADRMEALTAGTGDFIRTTHSLAFLQIASMVSRSDLIESWESRRLADDLPQLIAANSRYLARTRGELLNRLTTEKTRWFDTHPCHNDRIRQVELLNADALLRCETSADQLFSDFGGLCQRATLAFYRTQLAEKVSEAQLVPTDKLAEERFATRQSYRTLRRYLRGHLVPMQPIFPHPDACVALDDGTEATPALRAAREQMLRSGESLIGTGTANVQKDVATISVANAQIVLCNIFSFSPKTGKIRSAAAKALATTVPRYREAIQKYQPFAHAARARLTIALRLFNSDGPAVQSIERGNGELAAARARMTEVLGVCELLEKCILPINRLAELAINIRVVTPAHQSARPHPPLVRQILATTNEAADILRQFWRDLSPIRFPYAHAMENMSIGGMMVPKFPDARDPVEVHAAASQALDAYSSLVFRALAELTERAEQMESAIGLEMLPEIAEKNDAQAIASERRGKAWRYWLSYSGRAAAGVAMFALLLSFSIHPPVLPEMPWDHGSAPGGYQPDSFHVPFTPAPMSSYSPVQTPGRLPNGLPNPARGPQQYMPMRPGGPRPPGYPSNNGYRPGGSGYSPSPWSSPSRGNGYNGGGGWNGGGGGGGRPGGGGGGGHR